MSSNQFRNYVRPRGGGHDGDSVRLFWADEFALIHDSNPVEAVKESWELTRKAARQIFSFQFLAGLVAYPVLFLGFTVTALLGIPLAALAAFGPVWLATLTSMTVTFIMIFLGYALLHAPELVYFYGIRAARQILDPEELAAPNWIEAARRQAISPK